MRARHEPGKRIGVISGTPWTSTPRQITRHAIWHQETPGGTVAVAYVEGDDPEGAVAQFGSSDQPLNAWFRDQMKEVHGVDISRGAPSVFQRGSVLAAAGTEHREGTRVGLRLRSQAGGLSGGTREPARARRQPVGRPAAEPHSGRFARPHTASVRGERAGSSGKVPWVRCQPTGSNC